MSFNKQGRLIISADLCRCCGHCVISCPVHALTMEEPEEHFRVFQAGMAGACQAVLREFDRWSVYCVSVLTNITPLCDCCGFSTSPLVPDVGILVGDNLVAIDQASIDMIDYRKLIEENVSDQLSPPGKKGHLFQRLHGKDPYEQVRQCVKLGLGKPEYQLTEIR